MEKVNLNNKVISYPMPVVLVGSKTSDGKSDFLTVSWVTMVSDNPCKILVSLCKKHKISSEIKTNEAFSICVPTKSQINDIDYCGVVENENKADLFHIFYGDIDGTPMIEECKINAECKLEKVVDCGSHELFLGDILKVYADNSILSDEKVCLEKLEPMLLDGEMKKYREIGKVIGDAFKKM